MAALGAKHSSDELVIIGFPSREFGQQEFETDAEIQDFADSKNFKGHLVKLGHVTGPGASEIWKFFMRATRSREPNWNFAGKFLVSKSGRVVLPTNGANSLEEDIARLLVAE